MKAIQTMGITVAMTTIWLVSRGRTFSSEEITTFSISGSVVLDGEEIVVVVRVVEVDPLNGVVVDVLPMEVDD
jgi:hypothetical protein